MRRVIGGLWAGWVSAAICYAEYVGLGAMLGNALIGYGDQSKAVGTLLVVLAASITCLILSLRRLPLLGGPRAASLSILVLALLSLQSHYPTSSAGQLAVLAGLMLGCAFMLLLGSSQAVQAAFDAMPVWLVPSFIYASSVSIVASATQKYLHTCLLLSEWQTWLIFLTGTVSGLLWLVLCKQGRPDKPWSILLRSMQGLSLVVGAGVAWLLYAHSALAHASAGMCARLGVVELRMDTLSSRLSQVADPAIWGSNWQAIAWAFLWGIFVGLVLCIETRTTVDALARHLVPPPSASAHHRYHPSALTRSMAGTNALITPAMLVPSALSQSRTLVLWGLFRPSSFAVFIHALALLLIAFMGSTWLARLPQIALAVLMTLVACSMLGDKLVEVWQQSHSPEHAGVSRVMGLWLVMAISILSGHVMLGFGLPALFFLGPYLRQTYFARQKKRLTE